MNQNKRSNRFFIVEIEADFHLYDCGEQIKRNNPQWLGAFPTFSDAQKFAKLKNTPEQPATKETNSAFNSWV